VGGLAREHDLDRLRARGGAGSKSEHRPIGGIDQQRSLDAVVDIPDAAPHQRIGALLGRNNLDRDIGGCFKDVADVSLGRTRDAFPAEDRHVGHVGGAAEDHAELGKGQRKSSRFGEPIDSFADGVLQTAVLSLGRHFLDDRPVRLQLERRLLGWQGQELVDAQSLSDSHQSVPFFCLPRC